MGNLVSNSRTQHSPPSDSPAPAPAPAPPLPAAPQSSQSQTSVFAAPSHYPAPNLPIHSLPRDSPDYHRCPSAPLPPPVVHQSAITIRNDVNVQKDTIRIEEDDEDRGKFLVSFTFDAIASGSLTIVFFGKETADCDLKATKESVVKTVNASFEKGIGQKFRQPEGTGIDFSVFEEMELKKEGDGGVYPLVVKTEVCPPANEENSSGNSQITLAVFDRKENGEYIVRTKKQILWVNNTRYELQEIYGIGNSVSNESDENDIGKECVICMSEPRDTTLLPCRHMCMCSACAKLLQFQAKRCPICRQPVERLLEIKVNGGADT